MKLLHLRAPQRHANVSSRAAADHADGATAASNSTSDGPATTKHAQLFAAAAGGPLSERQALKRRDGRGLRAA